VKRIRRSAKFAHVPVKSRTANPRELREQVKLKPGDTLPYPATDGGVMNPFAVFSELASEADEAAYRRL